MDKVVIFLFGFSSGLPFLLILSTLSVWLAELGVSKTVIGMLAWVSVPYTFKFLWGALVDRQKIPLLSTWLGMRRSWILVGQILVWLFLIALGNTNPSVSLLHTAVCALLVGCASAIQDIAIEAYRIELLPKEKITAGTTLSVLGYRLGMLCSGAGTIFLAAIFDSWSMAYNCIAAFMLVGIITTLCASEPLAQFEPLALSLRKTLTELFKKFDWQIVFPFILSYKIADTVLNVMSMPFLVEIGFNNLEIASVAKTFGISAMILGGLLGGIIAKRYILQQYLLACVILQAISSCLFVLQAYLGHNLWCLFVSMGVENLVCGMSQVALISYLSYLCNQRSTALHYAILSSFASFMRVCISAIAGWMADQFAWPQFYAIVSLSCVPSLILLIACTKHFVTVDGGAVYLPNRRKEIVDVNKV